MSTDSKESGQSQKPIDEFISLIQNPFKSAFQVNAVWVSLWVSLGVTIVLALLFSLFRPRSSVIYAPKIRHADRKHAPPPISSDIFGWWNPVMRTKEQDVIGNLGLDATVFLRFARMCRNMFLVLSVLGCGIMIPVNIKESKVDSAPKGLSAFTLMTPLYVFNESLWSQVACAWAFDGIVCGFLWWTYRAMCRLRRQYFESPEYKMSLHARTLLIRHIPKKLRTDEGLLRITDKVNPTTSIPRAAIGRNVKELPELFEEHEKAVKKLEEVLAKYFKKPDNLPPKRPLIVPDKRYRGDYQAKERDCWNRPKVDAIDYLTDRIRQLEVEIKIVRESIDKRNAMSYGFASFKVIEAAHMFAHAARRSHPLNTTITLAPRPNDLIWENLHLTRGALRRKRFLNWLWSVALTVLYIVPNALIAIFLTDLSNLASLWKAFSGELGKHPKLWAAVQGIASPALTSLVYLILPSIFRRLATRAGDTTKTSREQHVIGRLYAFFVFNNLFVFSVFSAVSAFVMSVIKVAGKQNISTWDAIRQGHFFVKVMTTLCQISPFWVTYILQRNLGAAIDLAQLWQLVWKWFKRTFRHPTPRDAIEWTAPASFQYAMYYNYFLFYTTIALSFATLQPIVLPVTAFYFAIDVYMKKYLLLYVFVTKTESGGLYWKPVFNRCLFACIFANLVTALVVKARGTWSMVFALIPLPFLVIGFKLYCRRKFDDDLLYVARKKDKRLLVDVEAEAAGDKSAENSLRQLNTRFGNPVFYKQFMTPMVHAKAADALEKILESRRGAGGVTGIVDPSGGYSDIALHTLDPVDGADGKGGKRESVRKSVNKDFEVISENQLDFAYFKDRPEFREEFGGEGAMYGYSDDYLPPEAQGAMGYYRSATPNGLRAPTPGYADTPMPPPFASRANTGMSASNASDASASMGYNRSQTPTNVNPYTQRNVMPATAPYHDVRGMGPTLPDVGLLSTPSPYMYGNSSQASLNSSAGLLQHGGDYPSRSASPSRNLLSHADMPATTPMHAHDHSDNISADYEAEMELQGAASGVGVNGPAMPASPLSEEPGSRNRRSVAQHGPLFDQRGYAYDHVASRSQSPAPPGTYGNAQPGYYGIPRNRGHNGWY